MSRSLFLTLGAAVAAAIGLLALTAPNVLLTQLKFAQSNPAAEVMARTVGVLLLSVALVNFLVRKHPDSPTLKAILIGDLFLQLAILPIDPWAFYNGTFNTLASFIPNTIIHILLAAGFIYYLATMEPETSAAQREY